MVVSWCNFTRHIIGDYAGSARLAFAVALLILPILLYRVIIAHFESDIDLLKTQQAAGAQLKPQLLWFNHLAP